jgi:pyruvate dehydrogenase E1 component beta subunit
VPDEEYVTPIGKADVKRPGSDVTIVTWGRMVQMSLEAAEALASDGIDVEVLDPRTLVPLDREAIVESVARTSRLVVVHEAVRNGGYAGEIIATVTESDAFYYLDARIERVCGEDIPIPYNPELERNAVPTVERIVEAVRRTVACRTK